MKIPKIRKRVEGIEPYAVISSQTVAFKLNKDEVLKLDWNESALPPNKSVNQAVVDFVMNKNQLHWYPELFSKTLSEKLADYVGVSSDHILATNGSDDSLDAVLRVFLENQDEVLVPAPTYTHFLIFARVNGGKILNPLYPNIFKADPEWLRSQITENTKVIYLANPNNPTGVLYMPDQVESLIKDYPEKVFIIDEAYYEFGGVSSKELVKKYGNIFVTRTFSKAFGLAGLRIGYVISSPHGISALKKVYSPKAVNAVGQVAAMAALDNRQYMNKYVKEVKEGMKILNEFFKNRHYTVHSTQANYLLVQVDDVQNTLKKLIEQNVFVRDRSKMPGLDGYIRFTIPSLSQLHDLIKRIDSIF